MYPIFNIAYICVHVIDKTHVYYCVFQEHEVEKMFTLKSGRLPSADVKNIIFFVRPRLELMDIIAENVFRSVYGSHFSSRTV